MSRTLITLLSCLLVAACTTFTIDTRQDKDVDLSRLETFAWSSLAPDITGDADYARPEVDEVIRALVTQGFEQRGYQQAANQGAADFLISYRLVIESRLTERVLNDTYEVGPGWGPVGIDARQYARKTQDTYIIEYAEGTLIIDVFESDGRRLLWRGSVQGELDQEESWAKRRERLRRAVRDLLRRFPPR